MAAKKNYHKPAEDPRTIGGGLKAQGRERREKLQLIINTKPQHTRNDLLPEMKLQTVAIGDIVMPKNMVRMNQRGTWDLDELKLEFEELISIDAPIEVSGFQPDEIDQIIMGDDLETVEEGDLTPHTVATARLGDIWELGPHRLICGSSTDPKTFETLTAGDPPARFVLTDEPYNVPIAGHVTGGAHREFAMASGGMFDAEFLAFNKAWMAAVLPCLRDGGILGTYIDLRGLTTVQVSADSLGLTPFAR